MDLENAYNELAKLKEEYLSDIKSLESKEYRATNDYLCELFNSVKEWKSVVSPIQRNINSAFSSFERQFENKEKEKHEEYSKLVKEFKIY